MKSTFLVILKKYWFYKKYLIFLIVFSSTLIFMGHEYLKPDIRTDFKTHTVNDIGFRLQGNHKLDTTIDLNTTTKSKEDIKICIDSEMDITHRRSENSYYDVNREVKEYTRIKCERKDDIQCRLYLLGPVDVNTAPVTLDELAKLASLKYVKKGGWFLPTTCRERRNVAVVIPFRNREEHLPILLRHLHPIMQRQQIHYRIFIIEQVDDYKFNRGKLMNVGYAEAVKFFPYDCMVFHDIDLLSKDDRNTFDCSSSPQHMCGALDKFKYQLPYMELFGGVEMFTKDHYELVNGFSNSFWGWGAEDDNLYSRLKWKGLPLWRPPNYISKYQMIKHKDEEPFADKKRFEVRKESKQHFATDGLINLQYDVIDINESQYYTRIKVNLRKDKDKMFGVKEFS